MIAPKLPAQMINILRVCLYSEHWPDAPINQCKLQSIRHFSNNLKQRSIKIITIINIFFLNNWREDLLYLLVTCVRHQSPKKER